MIKIFVNTVKPVWNDHPQDPKFVAVVDRWSLFRGWSLLKRPKLELQNGGRCRQVGRYSEVVVGSGLNVSLNVRKEYVILKI